MLCGIRIGELDRTITIEQVSYSINPIGNKKREVWSDFRTQIKAKFLTKEGAEVFQSEQQVGQKKLEILIRFDKYITQSMRVKDLVLGDYFYINSIQQNPREGYCILIVVSRDNRT